jgi:hypothetical protein
MSRSYIRSLSLGLHRCVVGMLFLVDNICRLCVRYRTCPYVFVAGVRCITLIAGNNPRQPLKVFTRFGNIAVALSGRMAVRERSEVVIKVFL